MPLKKASMKETIIIWVRMTLGIGMFNNPKRFAELGYI